MTYSRKKQLLIVGIVNKREVERGGQRAYSIRFRGPVHSGCKQPIAGQKDSSHCEAQWHRRALERRTCNYYFPTDLFSGYIFQKNGM